VEPVAVKAGSTVEEEGPAGSSGILQSILDEITKRDDKRSKVEEPEAVEEDETSEVPKTCPNCGHKMKPRWRSCPFCGLEFR
jgi:transposase